MIENVSCTLSHRIHSLRLLLRAWWQPVALLVAFFLPQVAAAIELKGLYETEVLVTSQGMEERNEAIRRALDEVLIRVSGDRTTPQREELQGLYRRALQLVQQYRYRALPQGEGQRGAPGLGMTQVLWVSFDQAAIDQALRRARAPLWGQARPATLVWVAVEDGGVRAMMGAETLAEPKRVMQRQAQRRGVPLFVPLWDLEDQVQLRFTDVWGNFQDSIRAASARYATEAILVGRLFRQAGGVWEARWSLYQGAHVDHWRAASPLQAEVLSVGVDGAADRLGQRFAQIFDESQSSRVRVTVRDINSVEDYARAMEFLQSLDVVTSLQVERVNGSYTTFDLRVRGDSSGLAQTISFGRTLLEIPAVVNLDESLQTPSWEMAGEAFDQLWYRLLQ